jgi:hypothetical protein
MRILLRKRLDLLSKLFPGVGQIFAIERPTVDKATGNTSNETVYGITSHTPAIPTVGVATTRCPGTGTRATRRCCCRPPTRPTWQCLVSIESPACSSAGSSAPTGSVAPEHLQLYLDW